MEQEKEEREGGGAAAAAAARKLWASTVFVCLLVGCGCQERERDYGSAVVFPFGPTILFQEGSPKLAVVVVVVVVTCYLLLVWLTSLTLSLLSFQFVFFLSGTSHNNIHYSYFNWKLIHMQVDSSPVRVSE